MQCVSLVHSQQPLAELQGTGVAAGHEAAAAHVPAWQSGLSTGQLASVRHCTQSPAGLQKGLAWLSEQSQPAAQSSPKQQAPPMGLQTCTPSVPSPAASAPHVELPGHPAPHSGTQRSTSAENAKQRNPRPQSSSFSQDPHSPAAALHAPAA